MRDLTRALIDGARKEAAVRGGPEGSEQAVRVLRDRLRPVIGSRGFAALLQQAAARLGGRYEGVAGPAREEDGLEEVLDRIRQLRGNGSADPDQVVADLLDEFIATLEQMIGPELVERLVGDAGAIAGGQDE